MLRYPLKYTLRTSVDISTTNDDESHILISYINCMLVMNLFVYSEYANIKKILLFWRQKCSPAWWRLIWICNGFEGISLANEMTHWWRLCNRIKSRIFRQQSRSIWKGAPDWISCRPRQLITWWQCARRPSRWPCAIRIARKWHPHCRRVIIFSQ